MPLLSPTDQDKLRDAFTSMTRRVRVLFFTQTIGCDTCAETREILDELPPLSDKISIEEVNLVLDRDKAAQHGVDRVPAVALSYEDGESFHDTRIRFLGAPSGYEFISLIQAVLLAGGRASGLTDANRHRIAAVDKSMTMQVFTTPT
jgi:alkyl hydroperoxide reductase subunit AhpF